MPVICASGSAGKRFRRSVVAKESKKPDMTTYSPKFTKCIRKKTPVSLWTRQLESREHSKRLGHKPIFELLAKQKLWEKEIKGPAYYDINLSSLKTTNMPEGKSFTTSKRIPISKENNPSPGTYCPDIFQHSPHSKKCFSIKPSFRLGSRFRPTVDKKLGPALYHPKDLNGIEALLNKRISKRGPYDIFTGPRDGTTIRNHFALGESVDTDVLYLPQSDIDVLLTHPTKKNAGIMYRKPFNEKIKPYKVGYDRRSSCIVEQESPGPASYDITLHTIKPAPQSKAPFNTTARSKVTAETCSPGPGRYFLDKGVAGTPDRKLKQLEKESFRLLYGSVVSMMTEKTLKTTLVSAGMPEGDSRLSLRGLPVRPERDNRSSFASRHLSTEDAISMKSRTSIKSVASLKSHNTSYRSVSFKFRPSIKKDTSNISEHPVYSSEKDVSMAPWRVTPISVVTILRDHPAVKDIVTIGVPQETDDKKPFALVVVDDEADVSEMQLLHYVNQRMTSRTKLVGGLKIVRCPKELTCKTLSE